MTPKKNTEQDSGTGFGGREEETRGGTVERPPGDGDSWERDLEVYPLRPPEEDPAWAVITVRVWLWLAVLTGLFILALVILGFYYD